MLHRALNLPMVAVCNGSGEAVHVAVASTNDNLYYDARGQVTEEELGQPFGLHPPYDLAPWSESLVYGSEQHADIVNYDSLEALARASHPNLPWPKPSQIDRLMNFALELDELCKVHGVTIRARSPMCTPLIEMAVGDEMGFWVRPTNGYRALEFDRDLTGTKGFDV